MCKGLNSKVLTPKYSVKKMFLKILQKSQKNTSAGIYFWQTCRLNPAILSKRRLRHVYFPMNFLNVYWHLFYRTLPCECFSEFNIRGAASIFLKAVIKSLKISVTMVDLQRKFLDFKPAKIAKFVTLSMIL